MKWLVSPACFTPFVSLQKIAPPDVDMHRDDHRMTICSGSGTSSSAVKNWLAARGLCCQTGLPNVSRTMEGEKGCWGISVRWEGCCILPRWWFQIFFIFTPKLGERIQFDLRIFFRWVGSTTNYLYTLVLNKSFIASSLCQGKARLQRGGNGFRMPKPCNGHLCFQGALELQIARSFT